MTERAAFVAETLEEVCRKLRRLAHGSEDAALMRATFQDKGLAAALTEGHSGELFVDALMKARDWRRLGQLWVAGASVDWIIFIVGIRRTDCPYLPTRSIADDIG